MTNKQYLVTVSVLKEEELPKDKLNLDDLPDTINALIEKVAPNGSLEMLSLYLVDDEQGHSLLDSLERHSVPFPEGPGDAAPMAKVVHLHARRRHPEEPHRPS